MKQKNKSLFWVFLALCTFGLYAPAQAQDDLYYDPATDAPAPTAATNSDDAEYREPSNITRRYDNDDYYNEDDDYAYQYSSRIRRFHRPAPVVDYYDPFFSDLYYYDPYFMPGNSIYTYGYNDYWTWRQWRRAQRWNSWYSWGVGPTWSPWGWNSCYTGFNAWNNPWAMNNYYYDPYWTWNGYNPYYGGYGYGNNWVDNSYYYSNTGNGSNFQPKTYTGVRRHGSTVNQGYARIAENNGRTGRLVAAQNGPVLAPRTAPTSPAPRVTKGIEGTGPSSGRTIEAREQTSTGRRPEDRNNTGREVQRPDDERTRPNAETPRRSESPAESRPRRNESETRQRTPAETRPSRTEERPRSYDRPSRTEERTRSNDAPSRTRTEESRPSRNESRTYDNGSNNRTYDSGSSSRSSSGSSGSSSGSSSGGRSSGGSSGGSGGSRGRN